MTINIYLNQIDKFIKRAHKNGYISKRTHIKEIRDKRDKKLWNKITSTEDNALLEQLPEKRSRLLRPRGHEYELPLVRTERFKRSFINRCLYTNCAGLLSCKLIYSTAYDMARDCRVIKFH